MTERMKALSSGKQVLAWETTTSTLVSKSRTCCYICLKPMVFGIGDKWCPWITSRLWPCQRSAYLATFIFVLVLPVPVLISIIVYWNEQVFCYRINGEVLSPFSSQRSHLIRYPVGASVSKKLQAVQTYNTVFTTDTSNVNHLVEFCHENLKSKQGIDG